MVRRRSNDDGGLVWLVTGASRGLGQEISAAALRRGDAVVATARQPESLEDSLPSDGGELLPVRLDVTDEDQATVAAGAAVERFGRIDVLVNNAGFGLLGAVEETTADQVRSLLATNVEGTLNVIRAVLPIMRAQGSGHVLNVSSLGGFAASAGNGVYGATKFAVEGLSEALAAEVAPLGVTVTIVEPGFFRTDFLSEDSIVQAQRRIEDYDRSVNRRVAQEGHGRQPGDPAKAAAAILAAVDAAQPPLRLALGADALERIAGKLDRVRAEVENWRELSLSTGYDDARGA